MLNIAILKIVEMLHRPRRLRKNTIIRNAVAETRLSKEMFVYPYFVTSGKNIAEPIKAMPGVFHFSVKIGTF